MVLRVKYEEIDLGTTPSTLMEQYHIYYLVASGWHGMT